MTDRCARRARTFAALIVLAAAAVSRDSSAPPGEATASAGLGVIHEASDGPQRTLGVGTVAPDFAWAAEGGEHRLSQLRGQVVVVSFWATWCLACRNELPALARVAASDPDVRVLAVNVRESDERVRAFVGSRALDRLGALRDPDGRATARYRALAIPSTFFIDREGIVRSVRIGEATEADIRAGIGAARAAGSAWSHSPSDRDACRRLTLT